MLRRPGWLRLLPIMIFVMSSLLALKSVGLVHVAVTMHNTQRSVVSTAEAATPGRASGGNAGHGADSRRHANSPR